MPRPSGGSLSLYSIYNENEEEENAEISTTRIRNGKNMMPLYANQHNNLERDKRTGKTTDAFVPQKYN